MLFSRVRDFRLRKKFLNSEHKIKVTKFVLINVLSKPSFFKKKRKMRQLLKQTFYSKKKLKQLKNNKVKIVRRCLYTDRTRGMFRSYNLSRNVFRDLMQFGLIPGYKKAAW